MITVEKYEGVSNEEPESIETPSTIEAVTSCLDKSTTAFLSDVRMLREIAAAYEEEAVGRREWISKICELVFPIEFEHEAVHMQAVLDKIAELIAFKADKEKVSE